MGLRLNNRRKPTPNKRPRPTQGLDPQRTAGIRRAFNAEVRRMLGSAAAEAAKMRGYPRSVTANVDRIDMPQIRKENWGDFLEFVKERTSLTQENEVDPETLRMVQSEWSQDRVDAIPMEKLQYPILVSDDGYVLDGNHRWIKAKQEQVKVKTLRIGLPVEKALDLMKAFPQAEFVGNSSSQDVERFEQWFADVMDRAVLQPSRAVIARYVDLAFRTGSGRVFDDFHAGKPRGVGEPAGMREGMRRQFVEDLAGHPQTLKTVVTLNSFCPTGRGGGIDPTCSPSVFPAGGKIDIGDGFTLVNSSGGRYKVFFKDGTLALSIGLTIHNQGPRSVKDIDVMSDRYKGLGIGRRALSKLLEFMPLRSNEYGNTSEAASKMWRAIGAQERQGEWEYGQSKFYHPRKTITANAFGFIGRAADKVRTITARVYNDLKSVVQGIVSRSTRVVADAVEKNKEPSQVTRQVLEEVTKGLDGALTTAGDAVSRGFVAGQIAALRQLGVKSVTAAVEWTVRRERDGTIAKTVCKLCRPLDGLVFTVDEAEGLFPRHPRCCCSLQIPTRYGVRRKIRSNTKDEIEDAIVRSRGKAKSQQGWAKDVKIGKVRPTRNVFCPTGVGGGVDPTCGKEIKKIDTGDSTQWITEFSVDGEDFYFEASTDPMDNDSEWTISFGLQYGREHGNYKLTNNPDVSAVKVLRRVQQSLSQFVSEKSPERISFIADKSERSRIRFYDRISSEISKHYGYLESSGDFDDGMKKQKQYVLTKKPTQNQQEWSAPPEVVNAYSSIRAAAGLGLNVFCPTGQGGGVDPTCTSAKTKLSELPDALPEESHFGNQFGPELYLKNLGYKKDGTMRIYGLPSKKTIKDFGVEVLLDPSDVKYGQLSVTKSLVERKIDGEQKAKDSLDKDIIVVKDGDNLYQQTGHHRSAAEILKTGKFRAKVIEVESRSKTGKIKWKRPSANGFPLNVFCATGQGGGVDPTCSPKNHFPIEQMTHDVKETDCLDLPVKQGVKEQNETCGRFGDCTNQAFKEWKENGSDLYVGYAIPKNRLQESYDYHAKTVAEFGPPKEYYTTISGMFPHAWNVKDGQIIDRALGSKDAVDYVYFGRKVPSEKLKTLKHGDEIPDKIPYSDLS